MSRTPRSEPKDELVLRTAAVWGTCVVASRDLNAGQSLLVGDGEEALIAKPDASSVADLPIRAVGAGWELDARGTTGGVLHLRGRQEDPSELGKSGAPIPIVAGDYGVLQYGSLSVFFQFSHAAPPPRSRWRLDLPLLASFVFALLMIGGGLALLYMLFPHQELAKPLELTSPEELKVKYKFTPPPLDEAPGKAEAGEKGKKAKKPKKAKGRNAKRAPGPPSKSESSAPSRPAATQGLSAVTDVMQGAVGKEVMETLGTISSVADALGGLGQSGVVLGGGSGGVGLKASGAGGGQGGTAVFGSGTLDTGFGTGAGSAGTGRGKRGRGKGAGGKGDGRGGERRLKAAQASRPGQGLSRAQISRVVNARAGAFRACYESAAARNPKLAGGITVGFAVSPGGSVTPRIAKSSLGSARVEGCVLRMFKRLKFPKADKATKASWPFMFRLSRK